MVGFVSRKSSTVKLPVSQECSSIASSSSLTSVTRKVKGASGFEPESTELYPHKTCDKYDEFAHMIPIIDGEMSFVSMKTLYIFNMASGQFTAVTDPD